LRVRGSGVCMSMKAIEGRRRTMCEEGYLRSSSRSRYLVLLVEFVGEGGAATLPRRRLSADMRLVDREKVRRGMYIVSQPVVLQRIDILFCHYIHLSVPCPS